MLTVLAEQLFYYYFFKLCDKGCCCCCLCVSPLSWRLYLFMVVVHVNVGMHQMFEVDQ